jgi:methylmalonyl-CoA mutase C-terminal domain/subunit
MTEERKLKIIIAKPGLDGHDRGAKVVARALRDAGFEVVYTGIRQTPEMIAETALQEDADAVGLSILSGAHLELFPRVVQELKKRGMDDVVLFGGGIIPREDLSHLEQIGFKGIFGPGSSTIDIVEWVRQNISSRGAASRS